MIYRALIYEDVKCDRSTSHSVKNTSYTVAPPKRKDPSPSTLGLCICTDIPAES